MCGTVSRERAPWINACKFPGAGLAQKRSGEEGIADTLGKSESGAEGQAASGESIGSSLALGSVGKVGFFTVDLQR